MKKILLLTILAILVFSVSSCAKKGNTPPPTAPPANTNPAVTSTTPPVVNGTTSNTSTPASAPVTTPENDPEIIAEAAVRYDEFLDIVNHIENDNAWKQFLDVYSTTWIVQTSKAYTDLSGGTEEEWRAMSDYEQFLLYETYYRILSYLKAGEYDLYFGNVSNYEKYVITPTTNLMKRFGEEEAEAFRKLSLWQFDYVTANGAVYNFMAHTDSNAQN